MKRFFFNKYAKNQNDSIVATYNNNNTITRSPANKSSSELNKKRSLSHSLTDFLHMADISLHNQEYAVLRMNASHSKNTDENTKLDNNEIIDYNQINELIDGHDGGKLFPKSIEAINALIDTDQDNYIVYRFGKNQNCIELPQSVERHSQNVHSMNSMNVNNNNKAKDFSSLSPVNLKLPSANNQSPARSKVKLSKDNQHYNIVSFLTSCCIPNIFNSIQQAENEELLSDRTVYTTIAFEPASKIDSEFILSPNSTDDAKSAHLSRYENLLPTYFATINNLVFNEHSSKSKDNNNNCANILSIHELFCNCKLSCCCLCQCAFIEKISECLACFHTVCGQLSDAHYCKLGSYEHVYPLIDAQSANTTNSLATGTGNYVTNDTKKDISIPQKTYSKDMVSYYCNYFH